MSVYQKRTAGVVASAAMLVALGFSAMHWGGSVSGEEPRANQVAASATSSTPPIDREKASKGVNFAKELSHAFRQAAADATPATVKIRSHSDAKPVAAHRGGNNPLPKGDNPLKGTPFEKFFGEDGEGMQDFGGGRTPQRDGVGSGVIVDGSGIVLTNNHVVEGADTVTIRLPDGREFKGTDIKTDPQSDLAVVHIKTNEKLPVAKLGNSDELENGDWVLAIGNPFELETTVSAGIISGKGRELGMNRRAKFLQTDAAINPGNSGGALVNLDGEVIGINTAIASSSGGYQGIGFAIPINQAKWVMQQLISKGSVQRAYLGVGIGEMSDDLAEKLGVKKGDGVAVMEVQPNSPAAEAGLKPGDVITAIGDLNVKHPRELQEAVERMSVDGKQTIHFLRDGKSESKTVAMKALPDDVAKAGVRGSNSEEHATEGYTAEKFGLTVTDMSKAQQRSYKSFEGVVVSNVTDDGAAAAAGLREGMLILEVNKKPVKDVASFEQALKNASSKDGTLLLVRNQQGAQMLVVLRAS